MRVLTPVLFSVSLLAAAIALPLIFAPGCGPNTGANVKTVAVDTGLCELGQVPGQAAPLLTDLKNSVDGKPDAWGNATSAAINAGVGVAECLFAALAHFLSSQPPTELAPGVAARRDDRLAVFKAQVVAAKAKQAALLQRADTSWLAGADSDELAKLLLELQ